MSFNAFMRFLEEADQALAERYFAKPPPPPPPPRVKVHRNENVVQRDSTPLIQQRGWIQNGNSWRGHYASQVGGTYQGYIERRGDVFAVLIRNPPPAIEKYHAKWICFHQRKRGWWQIHLHNNPCDRDPSAIIAYVERILAESFSIAARSQK